VVGAALWLGAASLGGFALLLVLVVTGLPGVHTIDMSVADRLHRYVTERSWLSGTLVVVSHLTEPFVLRAVFVLPAVLLWRVGARRALAWTVTTLVVGGVLNAVVKLVVDRARPVLPDPIMVAAGASFPSGHTTNAVLFAGVVVILLDPRLRRRLWPAGAGRSVRTVAGRVTLWTGAGLFVALVGFDRIGLGVHYLSDVVGGVALGLSVLLLTLVAFTVSDTLHQWSADIPTADRSPDSPPTPAP